MSSATHTLAFTVPELTGVPVIRTVPLVRFSGISFSSNYGLEINNMCVLSKAHRALFNSFVM